jgi:hypothetical protein
VLYQAELHPENGKPASFQCWRAARTGARSVLKRTCGFNGFR